LSAEDLTVPAFFKKPRDILQLEADAINVLEKKVDISSFDKRHQQKIKDYYRFSATRNDKFQQSIAKMTRNTWDII
jgi:hypothetical protein